MSRKVRTAVQRNRAKRRLREVVRRCAEEIPEGVQIVCVGHPDVAVVPFDHLVQEFCNQLGTVRSMGTQ